MREQKEPNNPGSYCGAHVDLVAAMERLRALVERSATATDALISTVRNLTERIAGLETRVSLYAALLGACAGVGGWIIGALIVHWISKR